MKSEENKLLGATVPQEWIEKFEKLAKQKGCSISVLVREALGQYIGIDSSSVKVISQLEQFQKDIKLLQQKIAEVELYKTQIKDLSIRLAVVEQGIGKVQSQSMISKPVSSSESWMVNNDMYDDYIDDEPDEVLTDFAPRPLDN